MEISRGKLTDEPIRAVIYGPEGIGKSTLAAAFPAPLFVDTERGTSQLEVDRVCPGSWAAVDAVVAELQEDAQGFKTIVFDTADWLERMAIDALCGKKNWESIETPGYGKGFTMLAEKWRRFLDSVGVLQARQKIHVVFVAHSWLRKFEQPDESGAYDRWEMKLSKQVAPAMKEWPDLLLFLNYRTIVEKDENGKAKAHSDERTMYATHHACWDAKNRFGLADKLPLDFESIRSVFDEQQPAAAQESAASVAAVAAVAGVADVAEAVASAKLPVDPEKVPLLDQLRELLKSTGTTFAELDAELARKGVVPAGTNPRDYNLPTLKRVVAGWTAITHNITARNQETDNG